MKYSILTYIAFIFVLALNFGCATRGTVVVDSNPADTKVFWIDMKTGQSALLGQTPFTFKKDVIENNQSEVIQLKFEKEGFESKFTSVATFGQETTFLNIELQSLEKASTEIKKAFDANRQLLQDATRLAAEKRFSESLTRIEKILENDPNNDEALAAKGSLLFLMKDYGGAEQAWKRSLQLNPDNESVRSALIDLNLGKSASQRRPANSISNEGDAYNEK